MVTGASQQQKIGNAFSFPVCSQDGRNENGYATRVGVLACFLAGAVSYFPTKSRQWHLTGTCFPPTTSIRYELSGVDMEGIAITSSYPGLFNISKITCLWPFFLLYCGHCTWLGVEMEGLATARLGPELIAIEHVTLPVKYTSTYIAKFHTCSKYGTFRTEFVSSFPQHTIYRILRLYKGLGIGHIYNQTVNI